MGRGMGIVLGMREGLSGLGAERSWMRIIWSVCWYGIDINIAVLCSIRSDMVKMFTFNHTV